MGNLLSKPKPQAPPAVATDTIVPMHHMDDNNINRSMVVMFMMRFDDVLDPEKLKGSLEKLLSRDDWRKLGTRIRLNEKGKLDCHIPEKFDEKRPAVGFSQVKYDVEIGKHPLASRLPRASSRPAVVGDPEEFRSLMRREDGPKCLNDYIYRDEPQLSMHIVSFEDATLVTLSWLHTFLDAMGRRELMQAWIAVLEGRDSDVKPLLGVYDDPLKDFGLKPQQPFMYAHQRVTGWKKAIFVMRYIFELVWYPKEESRIVCLPAAHMQKIRADAMADLELQDKGDGKKPFVSDGDLVSGWITRLFIQQLERPSSTRKIQIMNAFGLRATLANDLLPSNSAYVANAVTGVYALVSAKDLLTKPLSFVASEIRRSIAEQGERSQLEARRAIDRVSIEKTGQASLFGDAWMRMIIISNWTKGRFFENDFSAAVVKPGIPENSPERSSQVGRPSYIQTGGYSDNTFSLRNAFPIIGKDHAGNYWLMGSLRKGIWPKIEEVLNRSG
ncbi:hypothetical protein F5B22DRAFT_620629 [Xylaria bambusicola]|uniref:uncharacterized protein n=1 Tax=Xylaria bambusicola TaxID=326684 RepID=UPI0020078E24|nr:uncharacterized protein F5B22DRAFT_620629 [Xylaria bambusicola]KAI0508451.1 hypothetical protein F5B22DRAFT_620629 [Xylaria bambusicola]